MDARDLSAPEKIWFATRRALESAAPVSITGTFALRLQLHLGTGTAESVATRVKRLIDGTTAGLHEFAGPSEDLLERIASAVGKPVPDIEEMLATPPPVSIGPSGFVFQRSTGLQWSPEDARCTLAALTPHSGAVERGQAVIEAALFADRAF